MSKIDAALFLLASIMLGSVIMMYSYAGHRQLEAGNDVWLTPEAKLINNIREERAYVCAENPNCPFVRPLLIKPYTNSYGDETYNGDKNGKEGKDSKPERVCELGYGIAVTADRVVCLDLRIQDATFEFYGGLSPKRSFINIIVIGTKKAQSLP